MPIDTEGLVAIDVHAHLMADPAAEDEGAVERRYRQEAASRWKTDLTTVTPDEIASYYRERQMACVLFTVDAEAGMGRTRVPNEAVLQAARDHPDVIIPFASVDPWKGEMALREVEDLIAGGEVRGFKFHPSAQRFFPDDRWLMPLYQLIDDAGLPAVFHSGQTGIGRTMDGGGGILLKYSNPIHLDEVAALFPRMRIVIAHPSFPWQHEALAVAYHKKNVYIDLSGWAPKYFADDLVHYANTLLRDKVLFGSDYPVLTPDTWMESFETRGFRDEVKPSILKHNALRLLGLDGS